MTLGDFRERGGKSRQIVMEGPIGDGQRSLQEEELSAMIRFMKNWVCSRQVLTWIGLVCTELFYFMTCQPYRSAMRSDQFGKKSGGLIAPAGPHPNIVSRKALSRSNAAALLTADVVLDLYPDMTKTFISSNAR